MPATPIVLPSPTAVSGELTRVFLRWLIFFPLWNDTKVFDPYSETLFMNVADLMVSEGYRDAGYEFVNIDVSSAGEKRSKTSHACRLHTLARCVSIGLLASAAER